MQPIASASHLNPSTSLEWLDGFLRPEPWMQRAACAGTDSPEEWFPQRGQSIPVEVLRTCGACPVRAECRSYAAEHRERHGVWGGLTARQTRARPSPTP